MAVLRSCLVLLLVSNPAWSDELRTLSGKTVIGSLTAINDAEITLKTESGLETTPILQALLLEFRPARVLGSETKAYDVRLLDDTSLLCQKVTLAGKDVELTLVSGTMLKLPLSNIVSILKDANDPSVRRQWTALAKTKSRRDRILILRAGDLNALEGTLGDVDAGNQSIAFKRETGDVIPAKLDLLHGLVFFRTEAPQEAPICKVIDVDGNNIAAAKLGYDAKTLTVTTTFGSKIPLKEETLARLDFNFGKLTYLSDLDPAKLVEPVFLGGFASFRRDVSLDGGAIRLVDRAFAKGLSMYGGVEVEYDLAGKYKEFKATLGADLRLAEEGAGKATITIYCDGEKKLTEAVSAKETRAIALSVKDVTTLRIVVSGPNFTGYTAQATLADARVSQ